MRRGLLILSLLLLAAIFMLSTTQETQVVQKNETNVSITLIEMDGCTNCHSASLLLSRMNFFSEGLGLSITNRTVDWDSEIGRELIAKYNITRVPTLVISKEAGSSIAFLDAWGKNRLGTQESDGTYVMRNPAPPYYDVDKRNFVGEVTVIEIVDSDCSQCLNLTYLYDYFWRAGIPLANITSVDHSSAQGQELTGRYNITKTPSAIISKDAEVYDLFDEVQSGAGIRKEDGAYVFKDPFPPYYDTIKEKIVESEN